MPSVHYGRLPDQELRALWDTDACRAYKDNFQKRVQTYEDVFVQSLTGGARPGPERLKEMAVEAMPGAMEGCRVCHYLYDV